MCMKQYTLPVVMLKCRHRICSYTIQDSIRSSLNSARPTAHRPLPFMAKAWSSSYLHLLCLQKKITMGKSCSLPSSLVMHTSQGTHFLPSEWRNPRQRFPSPWWACLCQAIGCFASPPSAEDTHRWGHTTNHPTSGEGRLQSATLSPYEGIYPGSPPAPHHRMTAPTSRATSTTRSRRLSSDLTSGISDPRWG